MKNIDSMSVVNADISLAELEEILAHEVFCDELVELPHVRFGPVRRHDHLQFCPEVRNTDHDIGTEMILAESIARDRDLVAMTLIYGMIKALAKQRKAKIACKAGVTKESEDYTGQYHNKLFKKYAEKYGLIVRYTGNNYGYKPVDISDSVKEILSKYHVEFTASRSSMLYGKSRGSNSGHKCICPGCGEINYYERKRQRLYCSECMDEAAVSWFGKEAWDLFITTYSDTFTIVRAKDAVGNESEKVA